MTTEHTPTPWRWATKDDGPLMDGKLLGLDNQPIATWTAFHGSKHNTNAEFIVRACNSFDDLLAALKGLVGLITPNVNEADGDRFCMWCDNMSDPDTREPSIHRESCFVGEAEAAIAKAEGKAP